MAISITATVLKDRNTIEPSGLVDSLTPAGVQPLGLTGYGNPVFSDEFNRASWNNGKWLPWYEDTAFWATSIPGGHKTNTGEPQGYDSSGLSMIAGGGIKMTFRNTPGGTGAVPELNATSGMICSYPSFSQRGGVWEIRARFPGTQGSWPAGWMFPTSQNWNSEGEIDFVEVWATDIKSGTIYANAGVNTSVAYTKPGGWVVDAFHTYTLVWEPGVRCRFYIDGALWKTDTSANVPNNSMHIHVNLAGDKDKVTQALANAPFSMDVAYVRAWGL